MQADESGYEGLTRYITKDPTGAKRYVTSKNLRKPQITVADYKFSRKKVNDIVTGKKDPQIVFERIYKGYEITSFTSKTSDFVTGTYIYVKMKKLRR